MTKNFKAQNTKSMKRPEPIKEDAGTGFDGLLKRHKISPEEYKVVRSIMGRAPTLSELGVFSAMWSEHCSYKSSRVHLKRFPTTGEAVVVGPGENAGVVRLSDKLCIAFKMESHNHPSYIEPFQGAATGVGGILRDVFCMGSRPIANLNCLRFGERTHKKTAHLVEHVVKGIGDYGNCVGIPTVGGNISFDASYDGNCLVNAMTVGVIHEDRIFKGYASGIGNLVVYVGSATGRDGIHGATMASGSFTADENQERSTVQVGDPFTEKLLLEATLEVLEKNLVVGIQDMGAAGLTSSSFEMAGRAGNGLYIDLDLVPTRTTAMTAYELMLSESQERMLMVITPENWGPLQKVLDKWQLANAVIGVVTDTGRVEVSRHGLLEIDVPVAPLTDEAPKYNRPLGPVVAAAVNANAMNEHGVRVAAKISTANLSDLLKNMLRDTGSKEPIYRQYDHHIGSKTVFGPEHQGAAVMWMRSDWANPNEEHLGLAIATNCNERYTAVNAQLGAAHAVAKCARMIAAAGGYPLATTDCLNFGNPEDPAVMRTFSDGVDGISEACRELNAPVVSGNVSLYNETDGVSIKPTPMIGMVGKVGDVRKAVPAVAALDGSEAGGRGTTGGDLYVLMPEMARPAFGGSLAARMLDMTEDPGKQQIPAIDWKAERLAMDTMRALAASGKIVAARDVGSGGIALTAAKMAQGHNNQAAKALTLSRPGGALPGSDLDEAPWWFAEWSACYVVQAKAGIANLAEASAVPIPTGLRLLKIGTLAAAAAAEIKFDGMGLVVAGTKKAFCESLPL